MDIILILLGLLFLNYFLLPILAMLEPGCPPELVASALQGMWGLLAALTGEDRAESALDQVFSGFCLGK